MNRAKRQTEAHRVGATHHAVHRESAPGSSATMTDSLVLRLAFGVVAVYKAELQGVQLVIADRHPEMVSLVSIVNATQPPCHAYAVLLGGSHLAVEWLWELRELRDLIDSIHCLLSFILWLIVCQLMK